MSLLDRREARAASMNIARIRRQPSHGLPAWLADAEQPTIGDLAASIGGEIAATVRDELAEVAETRGQLRRGSEAPDVENGDN